MPSARAYSFSYGVHATRASLGDAALVERPVQWQGFIKKPLTLNTLFETVEGLIIGPGGGERPVGA